MATISPVKSSEASQMALDLLAQIDELIHDDIGRYNKKDVATKVISNARNLARLLNIKLGKGKVRTGPNNWHVHCAKRGAAIVSGLAVALLDFDVTPRIQAELEKIIAHMMDVVATAKH